jgi:hypothetical protein
MKPTLIVCALLLTAASTEAGTIIDMGPPNLNATDIVDSRLADDFTLGGAAVVNDINFWYQAQFQTDLSSVTYAFYADSSGSLGSLITSGTVVPATSTDVNAYFATFAIPNLSLNAGTYWLELHAGSSLTDNSGFTVWWAASDASATYPALLNSGLGPPGTPVTTAGFQEYAFQLQGTGGSPVPEPSAFLLAGCGLAVLTMAKFKRGAKTTS